MSRAGAAAATRIMRTVAKRAIADIITGEHPQDTEAWERDLILAFMRGVEWAEKNVGPLTAEDDS